MRILASFAVVATVAAVIGSAPAADAQGFLAAPPASFVFQGKSYCFAPDGWAGRGWYLCGFAHRYGLGYGGPVGWLGRGGYGRPYGWRGPRVVAVYGGPEGWHHPPMWRHTPVWHHGYGGGLHHPYGGWHPGYAGGWRPHHVFGGFHPHRGGFHPRRPGLQHFGGHHGGHHVHHHHR